MSSLTGGNPVHDLGYISNGLTTSLEQLVVSNEVIGMVRCIMLGFEINEETLAGFFNILLFLLFHFTIGEKAAMLFRSTGINM